MEGTPYGGRLVLLEFPDKVSIQAWFNDLEYQDVMKFRHASSTMHILLVQEGGRNTEDPDPKLT